MLIGLLVSALIIVYIFVGYPFLLRQLARRIELIPMANQHCPSITAVFVVHNEQAVVAQKIQNILSQHYPAEKLQVLVVDDASNDKTAEIIASFNTPRLRYLKMAQRSGKPAGLNLALSAIDSELIFFLDARQHIEDHATRYLSEWFADPSIGAVSGELMLRQHQNGFSQGIDGYWRYEKAIRKAEAKIASVAGATGAIYMLRRTCFRPIPDDTLLDDVLIPMHCAAQGYRVLFDERAIAWDVPSADPVREKQRKIRTIRGNYQVLMRHWRWCLPFGHPIWWQFLSHKILRLTAPFVALAHFVFALALALHGQSWALWYCALLIAVVALYPLSLRWSFLTRGKPLRLLSAFIALNWYNVLGCYHYFFTEHSVAWKK